MVMNS
jgi:hypothetical protein